MKISINSIKGMNKRYLCADDIAPNGVDDLVAKIGARLGAVEEVVDIGSKYQGVVVVKVVKCEPHPNADRLKVCTIDDGDITPDVKRDGQGYVQVVCGAPNVHEGLVVAWLPPGSTVPSTVDKDPFVLEARELRGVVSNGMLASPRELGIGDYHEGIMELDDDLKPGTSFDEAYNVRGDVIIDLENKMFTHRPDCFGFLGVSRELAGIQHLPFKSPDWYRLNPEFPSPNSRHSHEGGNPIQKETATDSSNSDWIPDQVENDEEGSLLPLEVRNELPELVPRFSAVVMSDVTVGPSPVWLQIELAKYGLRSINNIVDYTNFFMLETGQPLHAYDYDKVKALDYDRNPVMEAVSPALAVQNAKGQRATLVIRHPKPGEKIRLLNGKEIEPRKDAIMIATNRTLIGIGGVMGGSETEVDETTKDIIIECASFDMYSIRRTAMTHGLFTDAVTRFTKGQSPLQNRAVYTKIADEIIRFANGKVAGLVDCDHLPPEMMKRGSVHPPVSMSSGFINTRLGLHLSAEEMAQLLTNVEFDVQVTDPRHSHEGGNPIQKETAKDSSNSDWIPDQVGNNEKESQTLTVKAPFWRTDIEIPEDVVEEIGRLYGFDHLPQDLPRRAIVPAKKDELFELKSKLRARLSKAGANEVLTYSFVHGNLLEKSGQDRSLAFQVGNALSPDLQYYRLSITPSLLEKVHANIKVGYDEFVLFELGKVHATSELDEDGLPVEYNRIALTYAAGPKTAQQRSGASYYQAHRYLMNLLSLFGSPQQIKLLPLSGAELGDHKLVEQMVAPFEPLHSAVLHDGERIVGVVGEYKASVRSALKLPEYSAGFEIFHRFLLHMEPIRYTPLPRFPKVEQDISLKVAADMPYQQLFDFVQQTLTEIQPEQTRFTLSPLDIYQRDDDKDHKQITLRLAIASYEKTLRDTEVTKLLDTVAETAQERLGAGRV